MPSWSSIGRKFASVFTRERYLGASKRVLEGAPGPSPWYLRTNTPQLPGFEWIEAGDSGQTAGAMALRGAEGPVLILDFHNYVVPLDPGALLIWHQAATESATTAPVVLRMFRLSAVSRLEGSMEALCGTMRQAKKPFAASAPPEWELPIPTTVVGRRQQLTFPLAVRQLEELLILCNSSAIGSPSSAERGNLALLIACPREETYELYPQDWFNNAGLDYGYQWVTRVARDPVTKRIHGEGVRISSFVLDASLRRTLEGPSRAI